MLSRLTSDLDRLSHRWIGALAQRTRLGLAVVLVVAGLCYLPGQTVMPAVDRTEGVVALSSRHILETGDLLAPRWGDNVQVFRPAGTFWVQAAAVSVRDASQRTNVAAYRLPSFLATLFAVGLIFVLGRGLFGAEPALLAALSVGVTPIVALHAQLAIAEPLILPLIVASQFALFGAYRSAQPARWIGWRGLFWVALGISTWFNALAVPLLAFVTVLGLIVADRNARALTQLAPWFGLPVFLVIALPWLISFWLISGGTPLAGLDWAQMLDVLEGGQAMKFKTVHGVFILFVALAFIPISHMLGPAVVRGWDARRERMVRFLLVWLIAPVVALEIFSNKPPLYTVQAVFPAGALLVALAATGRLGGARPFKAWPGFFTGATAVTVIAIPLLAGGLLWITGTPPGPGVLFGAVAIIALFVIAGWAGAKGQAHGWFTAAIGATVLLNIWFFGALMPGLANTWTAPQLRAVVNEIKACGVPGVLVSGFREPSLPLALGRGAEVLPGRAAGRAAAERPGNWAILEARERTAFNWALADAAASGKPAGFETRGCVRSINMARGCLLEFEVWAPVTSGERERGRTGGACKLSIPPTCPTAGRDRHWLDLKHCK